MPYPVEFYIPDEGGNPVRDFVETLSVPEQAKVVRTIALLRDFGFALREPYTRSLVGHPGLYELRVQLGSNIFRIFYFYSDAEAAFILLHGFRKKTQKTPRGEIELAERRRADCLNRQEEDR